MKCRYCQLEGCTRMHVVSSRIVSYGLYLDKKRAEYNARKKKERDSSKNEFIAALVREAGE